MKFTRSFKSLATVVAVAASVGMVSMVPAQAAITSSVDTVSVAPKTAARIPKLQLETDKTGSSPGFARLNGTATWGANRKAFTTSGKFDDVCPADGRGAVVYVKFHYDNGAHEFYHDESTKVVDSRGCEQAPRDYKITVRAPGGSRLSYVQVYLCEGDAKSFQSCDRADIS